MSAWKNNSRGEAREVIAFAVRHFGRARGWQIAARHLRISERTARGLTYAETSGASIDPQTVQTALMALRRERAAQLRAELNQLEAECGQVFSRGSAASSDGPVIAAGTAPNGARGKQGG